MKRIRRLAVFPRLPEPVQQLEDLAYNLWWAWHPEAQSLFRELDESLWEETGHNPVKLLQRVDQARLDHVVHDPGYIAEYDAVMAAFEAYLQDTDTWFARTYPEHRTDTIAYFSAEFGLHEVLPIYSGGLGILSGDHCKEASDMGIPLVGVGFLYPQGYFTQRITDDGTQEAIYRKINFAEVPARPAYTPDGEEVRIHVDLPGRRVYAKVWEIRVGRVPLYLMDTDVPENAPEDRQLAARLYSADPEMRISQEIILGIGGVRALQALNLKPAIYHLNEGHSAFLGLERIRLLMKEHGLSFDEALGIVRATSLFTTHTPVAAGHDTFPFPMMDKYFGFYWGDLGLNRETFLGLGRREYPWGSQFSMTVLAIHLAGYINGVSRLHGQVSRKMWKDLWPGLSEEEIPIGQITNGVHLASWLAPELVSLLNRHLPADWQEHVDEEAVWDPVTEIPDEELWEVRLVQKQRLVHFVRARVREQLRRQGASPSRIQRVETLFDPNALTIGFARRFATYKRATLIFHDLDRIRRLLNDPKRPVQIVFAGKAHPADEPGKEFIRFIHQLSRQEGFEGHVIFLENYDIDIARHLVQGSDVWLNNPRRPMEASGTSGQKAGANGVPNFSVLDGWWPEGYTGHNGWAIGEGEEYPNETAQDEADALSLYRTLEEEIIPQYFSSQKGEARAWLSYVRESIRTIAPRFSTRRMLKDYVSTYYMPAVQNWHAYTRDHFRLTRELAAWKRRVREHWDRVRVETEGPEMAQLRVGDTVHVQARVFLEGLERSDVRVEVVYGKVDEEGELHQLATSPLQVTRHDGPITWYEGDISLDESGQFGYAVRILPYHSALPNPFDMRLILWA